MKSPDSKEMVRMDYLEFFVHVIFLPAGMIL